MGQIAWFGLIAAALGTAACSVALAAMFFVHESAFPWLWGGIAATAFGLIVVAVAQHFEFSRADKGADL